MSDSDARQQSSAICKNKQNENDNFCNNKDDSEYFCWKNTSVKKSPSSEPINHLFLSAIIPRPTAWVSVIDGGDGSNNADDQKSQNPLICLLEGYSGASDRPPTLMLGSDSLDPKVVSILRKTGRCCVSAVTEHDRDILSKAAHSTKNDSPNKTSGSVFSFDEIGLEAEPAPHQILSSIVDTYDVENDTDIGNTVDKSFRSADFPPGVKSSPIQMHCRLAADVNLSSKTTSEDSDQRQSMILLEVELFVIRRSVLLKQHADKKDSSHRKHGNADVRRLITAKIEARLIRPVGSLGFGKFCVVNELYHMIRPVRHQHKKKENDDVWSTSRSSWIVDKFQEAPPAELPTIRTNAKMLSSSTNVKNDTGVDMYYHKDVTYAHRLEESCILGYNPTKQIITPRVVGWISTYSYNSSCVASSASSDHGRVCNLAPYSFFADVGRRSDFIDNKKHDDEDTSSMIVAFASCPRSGETSSLSSPSSQNDWKKDAHRDAEETGYFAYNIVTQSMATKMNATAAPVQESESEFQLASLTPEHATTVDAPVIKGSPITLECKYLKTVKVPRVKDGDCKYYLILGKVVAMRIHKSVLDEHGSIDVRKLHPVARLGYGQEYTAVKEAMKV